MSTIRFSKMHGLGNDFMVIETLTQSAVIQAEQVRAWADRHTGIGFDQLLLVEASNDASTDFQYRIFNADGSEVEQCGNGARCFAKFVRDQGLTDKNDIRVLTKAGPMVLHVREDELIRVNMGLPRFQPGEIPLLAKSQKDHYLFELDEQDQGHSSIKLGAVSLGNPHAVMCVDNIDTAPVETLGPILESHPHFPQRVNVGFMQVVSPSQIRLRVYERGAGETLACGSGACAAAIVGQRWGLLGTTVTVSLPGGNVDVEWQGDDAEPVYLTGSATQVYEGHINE